LAFAAIIRKPKNIIKKDRYNPELIDYNALLQINSERKVLEIAFQTAEKELDIPQLIEVEDMVIINI
jgi:hypothetical protein